MLKDILFKMICSYLVNISWHLARTSFSEWDMIFANQAMTVAAIDRLVDYATILEIITESYRKNQSMQKTKQ